jgi:signal transduction histidine kinase
MTKTSRILQTISLILAGALIALFMALMFVSIQDSREAIKKLDNLDARITNLEQDQQNTKEVLDAHGYEDLNL